MKRLSMILLAGAVLVPIPSRATTVKEPGFFHVFYYPGALCQPTESDKLVGYSQFGLYNPNTIDMTVVCPLPTTTINLPHASNKPFGTLGTRLPENIHNAYAVVHNNAGTISCTLRNFNNNGQILGQFGGTSGSPGSVSVVSFVIDGGALGAALDNFWDVFCTIPAASGSSVNYLSSVALSVMQP